MRRSQRFLFTLACAAVLSVGRAEAAPVRYGYDGAGRLVRVDFASGASVVYTWDSAGNLLGETVSVAPGGGDSDGDGVPDVQELGPSGGDSGFDGDGNGILDWQEGRVASLHDILGGYVTVTVPPGQLLVSVRAVPNPSPADAPEGVSFPSGHFELTVSGIAEGACTTVQLLLPQGSPVIGYFKHAPEPAVPAPHWWSLGSLATVALESGRTRVSLLLCDGGLGDADLAANGRIVDPGGPAAVQVAAAAIPTLGEWGALLLAVLTVAVGLDVLSRRRRGLARER